MRSDPNSSTRRFHLNPLAYRWLKAQDAALADADGNAWEDADWDSWLIRQMAQRRILDVGGVLVDRAICRQRFACVSDRCAPGKTRGAWRSCCADVDVPLTGGEARRIAQHRSALCMYLPMHEVRLSALAHSRAARTATGTLFHGRPATLARPQSRCIFSQVNQSGALRCHLYGFCAEQGLARDRLQPLACRLFPLVLIDTGRGRYVLTLLARHTYRLIDAYPPARYPCLSDADLPLLTESLASDLDWLFGPDFASAVREHDR